MGSSHRYYTEYLTIHEYATPLWTGSWHIRAIVPCCNCGWHGDKLYDDDVGRCAALLQWKREHLASFEGTVSSN
jgi:hypothetical protein